MQRFYLDRESYGPEFDDRLIRLVRENPAIYDVNHEHYRRNPVRVAIWERIATELRAPSKFLQTKWKNIRYNYLQEIKCLETGHTNSNIRKRRFTEDLSFLQNTAQTYKKSVQKTSSYNSSDNDNDNDSNSYMYPDPQRANAYEVIEIEHSDDGSQPEFKADNAVQKAVAHEDADEDDKLLVEATLPAAAVDNVDQLEPEVTIEQRRTLRRKSQTQLPHARHPLKTDDEWPQLTPSPYPSNPSSPLLTPLVVMGNGQEHEMNGEITIEPIPKQPKEELQTPQRGQRSMPASEIVSNAIKRKAMPAPFPVLTPINDPIELYCLSLVDSLRNMPRTERERVKYEFAKILKDAKYKDQS